MDDIKLTRTLIAEGYNHDDLKRLQQRNELVRVRRGAYATEASPDLTIDERHRRLVLGTAPQLRDGAILSHGSAAVLHGLPVWPEALEKVHVTRDRRGNGTKRSVVQVHGAPVHPREVTMIDGVPVTSLTRTVLDLARTLPLEQAVASGDRAMALGLRRRDLEAGLSAMVRWAFDRRAEQSHSSISVARASESQSAGCGCWRKAFQLLRYNTRFSDPAAESLLAWTSAGKTDGPSASLTARSSTAGCSNQGSGSKT